MSKAHLFIRNDDPVSMDRKFRYFFDLAIDHEIPVIHAVIPGRMDAQLIRFLCRAKEKTPGLLDIVQHGWMHTNHSLKAGQKYEFGTGRTLKAQAEDIARGFKKMQLAFGEKFTRVFVPPYHGYDQRTLRVLDDQGFQAFSAGVPRAGIKKRLIEIPTQHSFTSYEQGVHRIRPAKELLADLLRGIHRRSLSGVLTHHADFSTSSERKELETFFEGIAALRAKEGWRVLLFSDIL